jgi:hypothetical protein
MKKHGITALLLMSLCATLLVGAKANADGLDSIDAVINWENGKAYFFGQSEKFGGEAYVRYDMKADKADEGYPQPVNDETWPGLLLDDIVAVVGSDAGQVYFFGHKMEVEGLMYTRYNVEKDKAEEGYPLMAEDDNWHGISGLDTLDDAINIGDGNIYFIGKLKDDETQYDLTFDIKKDKVVGRPEPITDKTFPGNEIDNITAVGVWDNGKMYFFGYIGEDPKLYYERFDVAEGKMDDGYPKTVNQKTWPGVLAGK